MEKDENTLGGVEAEESKTGNEIVEEEVKPEDNQENDQQEDEKSAGGEKPNQALDDVIEGWREDRIKLEETKRENAEYKAKMERFEKKEDDEEYEGLSEDERIERIIAKKEKQAEELKKARTAEVNEEIRFLERTDSFFRDNKEKVLKVAADFNATNLPQAIKILKAQMGSSKKVEYDKKRKKEADGAPGGKSGKGSTKSEYNAEKDGKKSFGDLYRAGGVE